MNVSKENQYRMLASVRSMLTTHEPNDTWTEVPALVKAVGQLDTVITNMTSHFESVFAITGRAASKRTSLGSLVARATKSPPPSTPTPMKRAKRNSPRNRIFPCQIF